MSAGGERPRPDTSPLAEIGPRIVAHLNEKHAAREKALRASRALIQASARSIREAHRGSWRRRRRDWRRRGRRRMRGSAN